MKKIIISLMLLTTLCALVGCQKGLSKEEVKAQKEAQYKDALVDEVYVSFATSTDKLDLAVPDANDQDALKALAVQLYNKACWNDQHCDRRLAKTQNLITAGDTMRNLLVKIKNGDECLWYDLQPNGKYMGQMIYGHCEGMYAKVDLAHPYYERLDNSKTAPCRVTKEWEGTANFENANCWLSAEPTDMLYFHSKQKALYTATDAIITVDTIKTATISHNEEGYYSMYLELDPNLASQYMLSNLRGSNFLMSGAYYASINETIEIWDNGFFKRFLSEDKTAGGITTLSLHYDTYYSYDEADCDMTAYFDNYYATLKARAEEENAKAGN